MTCSSRKHTRYLLDAREIGGGVNKLCLKNSYIIDVVFSDGCSSIAVRQKYLSDLQN